jgi:hypothetical protein
MSDRVIAIVRDYQELIAALRARVVELGPPARPSTTWRACRCATP